MNKIPSGNNSIMLKAVCTALVLIFGCSLLAVGAMESHGCGMKCCCQSGPTSMQPLAEKQMRAPMGCCSGVPLSPCDLQSTKPLELPEMVLASSRDNISHVGGGPVILADVNPKSHNSGAKFMVQVLDLKLNPPPLYLSNLSFLI